MALVHIIQIETEKHSFSKVAVTISEAMELIRVNQSFATFGAITYKIVGTDEDNITRAIIVQNNMTQLNTELTNRRDNLAIVNQAIQSEYMKLETELNNLISTMEK